MHFMNPVPAAVRDCILEARFRQLGLRMVLVAGMTLSGWFHSTPVSGADPARDQITQISVMNALMLGDYRGTTTMETLLQAGNFGLGTFDHLDGELIVLDGQAWQAKSDGSIHRCEPDMLTPFAVVTSFEGEETFDCPPAGSLEQLEELLKARLPGRDAFVAVRVEGKFQSVFLRAVPRQSPPFRPLAEVVKEQSQWQKTDLTGTLIGCVALVGSPALGFLVFTGTFSARTINPEGTYLTAGFNPGQSASIAAAPGRFDWMIPWNLPAMIWGRTSAGRFNRSNANGELHPRKARNHNRPHPAIRASCSGLGPRSVA